MEMFGLRMRVASLQCPEVAGFTMDPGVILSVYPIWVSGGLHPFTPFRSPGIDIWITRIQKYSDHTL